MRADRRRKHGSNRAARRRNLFLYQDGAVLCLTLRGLHEIGLLEPSLAAERSVAELVPESRTSGFGYLRVGLRTLASQGWLVDEPALGPEQAMVRWTEAGRLALAHRDRYLALGGFLSGFSSSAADAWSRPWDAARSGSFREHVEPACERWRLGAELPAELRRPMTIHLDGALLMPLMLSLQARGKLGEDGPDLSEEAGAAGIARVLAALGWTEAEGGRWTHDGRQALGLVEHLGLVGSYLPLFARLPELYRGELTVASASRHGEPEWHVHRGLNIGASTAAHRRYFADADGIVCELFDREPLGSQPRFVADMGCGDGSWLVHIHERVRQDTLRGRNLDHHPLLFVGIDCNAAALERARRVLGDARVPALLLEGDVSDPERVRTTLAEHGLAMEDGLHIRSFLDHDRTYRGAEPRLPAPGWSSGAYVDLEGGAIEAQAVERDLIAHLARWSPHVRRHGMVVLEAHCVAPPVARRHLGALHSLAFDAYHGYSHQYPVEHAVFVRCCREAGIQPASHTARRYPSSRPFVAVSLSRLLAPGPGPALPALGTGHPRADSWQPEPGTDLEDGRALHELLFAGGDLRYPRPWCAAPTGFVVSAALETIERRVAGAGEGEVIRVLDYGAGSGLAAIELLKACRERRLDERLEQRGAELELHLADLPSSWFAQGFELLGECAWTRFHSLRDREGGFRPLLEVTGGLKMDAVVANMVFHLIPPSALGATAANLAEVLAPGGCLAWNTPDLGPAGAYTALFHDPNRALRGRWRDLMAENPDERSGPGGDAAGGAPSSAVSGLPQALPPAVVEALREARRSREGVGDSAQARADRRILPRANAAADVSIALSRHLDGEMEFQAHEILEEEVLDVLLVPSNGAEYLPEIPDRALREEVIRVLMLGQVLPAMREGPAGTSLGLNVQWTFGRFEAGRSGTDRRP